MGGNGPAPKSCRHPPNGVSAMWGVGVGKRCHWGVGASGAGNVTGPRQLATSGRPGQGRRGVKNREGRQRGNTVGAYREGGVRYRPVVTWVSAMAAQGHRSGVKGSGLHHPMGLPPPTLGNNGFNGTPWHPLECHKGHRSVRFGNVGYTLALRYGAGGAKVMGVQRGGWHEQAPRMLEQSHRQRSVPTWHGVVHHPC